MMWRGQEGTFNEVAGPLNPVFIMGVTHRGGDTFEHRPRGQQVAWANICLKHPCIPRCCNWFRQHVFNTFYQEFQRAHMLPGVKHPPRHTWGALLLVQCCPQQARRDVRISWRHLNGSLKLCHSPFKNRKNQRSPVGEMPV